MAKVKDPQRDLPRGIRGGSDTWDQLYAGPLITDDYFDDPPAPPGGNDGKIKYWTGSAWAYAALKRWDGSAWQTTALKFWNGSSWQLTS
jgi:hypothetical protein